MLKLTLPELTYFYLILFVGSLIIFNIKNLIFTSLHKMTLSLKCFVKADFIQFYLYSVKSQQSH